MEFFDLVASEGTEQRPLKEFYHVKLNKIDLKMCRFCLQKPPVMVNIFDSPSVLSVPIAEMIFQVTGHYVSKGDSFPKKICRSCLEEATRAFKIKQTYERSYQLLCQVKKDFQEVDDLLEDKVWKTTETQQVVAESFDDDLMENEEQYPKQLRVPVKTEPLDGFRYSHLDGFEVDSLEHEELDQCPVKNEPIGEDSFEEAAYQIYDGEIQAENKRLHKCSYCPKTFPRQSQLKDHIRSHTRERPFKCPQCPCLFTTKSSATRHLKSHVVEPFKCSHCSCSYKTERSFKRHLAMHKKVTSLKCDLCQQSCADKRTLESHRVKCAIMTKLIASGAMIVPTS